MPELPADSAPIPARRRTVLYLDHTAALSGGELALLELVQNLDCRRYVPVVVLMSDGPLVARLREAGIPTHVIPLDTDIVGMRKDNLGGKSLLKVKTLRKMAAYTNHLAQFLRETKPDILHTNSLKADIIGGFAARRAGIPLLWHIRDRIDTDYLPASSVRLFRLLSRLLPHAVIANSHATLATLALPGSKLTGVVYSGVALERYTLPTPQAQRSRKVKRLGIIGRITPWKGQHIFLQAAARVHERFPETQFQIIGAALFGEEAYADEMRALVASQGLESCVEFTGFRTDIPAALHNLDILVHASITGEPFGQVVVQGMAAGKPVIATEGGGIPEIVLPGKTGLLVPMGEAEAMAEAMIQLLTDPDRMQTMGEAGRRRVEQHFLITHSARAAENIYDALLQRLRRP